MKIIAFLFLAFPFVTFGQRTNDILTLRVGIGSANIGFKEALEPSTNLFGREFNTGNTFIGDGPEFGISKNISHKMFIDVSFFQFSGRNTKLKVNNNENYYTLKGYQLPVTINYLLRDNSKRLRFNLGGGFQYLKGHLQQYETSINNNGQVTNQINDIRISEFQLVLRPGVQFRIISNLYASFIVRAGISTNGRYGDSPIFSLKYTFKTKK
jgi:hypothetical protein